jgi:Zn-dependent peptidase ImmA (M78 family)
MSKFQILSLFIENVVGIKITYVSPDQYDFYFSPIGDYDNSSAENRIIVKRNFDPEKDHVSLAHELGHYLSMTFGYWSLNLYLLI